MSVPKYPKIDSLYNRKEDFSVDETKIRRPEFLIPDKWIVTEKIDGMNIRIGLELEHTYKDGLPASESYRLLVEEEGPMREIALDEDKWVVKYYGRNENSQFPPEMLEHLQKTFTLENMQALWRDDDKYSIVLYGEGYGAGIQKGGGYNKEKTFRLFDVLIGDVWLSRENVEDVAVQLGIKCAPQMHLGNIENIISAVRNGFNSPTAITEGEIGFRVEGVVCQTSIPLFNSRGTRLIWKLKTSDFNK
jgi:hypothetical protein